MSSLMFLPTMENPSAFDPGFFMNCTFMSTKVLFGRIFDLAGRQLESVLFDVELLLESFALALSFGLTSVFSMTFCLSLIMKNL